MPVLGLHQQGFATVDNAHFSQYRSSGAFPGVDAFSRSFHGDDSNIRIIQKMIVSPCGITASTYAGDNIIWIFPTFLFFELRFDFFRNHGLKPSYHIRIGMRPHHRTDNVMRVHRIIDPIANGLVGGIFQGSTSRFGRTYFGTQHFHSGYIGGLTGNVNFTHIHHTLNAHECTDSCGGHPMLTCTGLGNDSMFPQLFSHKNLPDGIVHLVRSGMAQIFSFEVDFGVVFFG